MDSARPKATPYIPKGNFDFLFLQLMLVMLAFFILLSSMAVIVKKKSSQAMDSVNGAFSMLSTGNQIKGKKGSAGKLAAQVAKNLTDVTKLLDMHGVVMNVSPKQGTMLIRLPGSLLFSPGQIKLSAAMNPFMDILADLLRREEVKSVAINGYTDNSPAGSRFKSNWELSAARAMQVFFSLAKRGVPKDRMVLAGMGSAHPLPLDQTHGDASMNRRVEVRITFKQYGEATAPAKIKAPEIKAPAAPAGPGPKQPS